MKILQYKMPDNFNLFLIGDEHIGSSLYSEHTYDGFAEQLCSEYEGVDQNFVVDHGDIADCITSRDKRFHPDEVKTSVREQEEMAVQCRKEIANRFLTIVDGNHPFKIWDVYGPSGGFTKVVCDRLKVPFGTTSCKIHYVSQDNKLMFKSYHQHGRRTINTIADDPIRRWSNMKLSLKRHLKMMAGDCILMAEGHTHKIITVKPQQDLYLIDDGERVVQKYTRNPGSHRSGFIHYDHRWYANTGSFLKLYSDDDDVSGYAERAGYDPIELGFVVVKVRDQNIIGLDRIII